MITDSGIIWCWSSKNPDNILYIFRGYYDKEIEIDLRLYKGQNYKHVKLTQNEKVFLNQLLESKVK